MEAVARTAEGQPVALLDLTREFRARGGEFLIAIEHMRAAERSATPGGRAA